MVTTGFYVFKNKTSIMQKVTGRRMAIEGYTLPERRRGPNKICY